MIGCPTFVWRWRGPLVRALDLIEIERLRVQISVRAATCLPLLVSFRMVDSVSSPSDELNTHELLFVAFCLSCFLCSFFFSSSSSATNGRFTQIRMRFCVRNCFRHIRVGILTCTYMQCPLPFRQLYVNFRVGRITDLLLRLEAKLVIYSCCVVVTYICIPKTCRFIRCFKHAQTHPSLACYMDIYIYIYIYIYKYIYLWLRISTMCFVLTFHIDI